MYAGGARCLREEHRAEFAGPYERDAQGAVLGGAL
jgi:hypothetical protein